MDRLRRDGRNSSCRKPWGAQANGPRPTTTACLEACFPLPLVLPQLTEKSNRITKRSRRASLCGAPWLLAQFGPLEAGTGTHR